MQPYKIIAFLVLLGVVAVFTFQNTGVVEIKFILWSTSMSVSLMLLASLFSGIVIGMILCLFNVRKKNKQEKQSTDAYMQ